MALTNAFQEAINERNVRKIRIMLKDSLLVDPTFSRFEEMERAASSIEGLYDQHDGRAFVDNPDDWNDDYMNKIMVQVVGNFSKERVEHLKDVVRRLRPIPKKETSRENCHTKSIEGNSGRSMSYHEQKHRDQQAGNYKYAVGIGSGVAIGGIAGCIGGSVASLSIGGVVGCTIGGAVLGATIGGAVVYYTNKKE